jgi:hypothetical protein
MEELTSKQKGVLIRRILQALRESYWRKFDEWQDRQRKKPDGGVIYNPDDPAPPTFSDGETFFRLVFLSDDNLREVAEACRVQMGGLDED